MRARILMLFKSDIETGIDRIPMLEDTRERNPRVYYRAIMRGNARVRWHFFTGNVEAITSTKLSRSVNGRTSKCARRKSQVCGTRSLNNR